MTDGAANSASSRTTDRSQPATGCLAGTVSFDNRYQMPSVQPDDFLALAICAASVGGGYLLNKICNSIAHYVAVTFMIVGLAGIIFWYAYLRDKVVSITSSPAPPTVTCENKVGGNNRGALSNDCR